MRLRRMLFSVNWKYAVGEVLLISVGVLIALAASDWQSRRVDRQSELIVLRELRSALADDLELLNSGYERFQRIEERVEHLLSELHAGAPYEQSLDAYFGTLYGVRDLRMNTAAYESLKSMGLGLISEDELRSQITQVYEQAYPLTMDSVSVEKDAVLGLLRPYFLIHFRDLRFNQSATPLDYDAISNDTEFLNLVSYRLELVKQNHIPRFERVISAIHQLIEAIESELSE